MGPSSDVTFAADAEVVDASGSYVIPGLWDAHVHSATNVEWHFPCYFDRSGLDSLMAISAGWEN